MEFGLRTPPAEEDEMRSLQREVADAAVFEDDFEDVDVVAGVDQAFAEEGEVAVSAAVAIQDGGVVETSTSRRQTRIPYIPGLLSFREGQAVLESVESLDLKPDILLVDGSGRIHPRQAGLATHVGVTLELPSIGVAKSLLCGGVDRDVGRLKSGERVEVTASDRIDAPGDEVVGYAFQSKQYSDTSSVSVNPLYVSPGHRVSAETAVDIVEDNLDGFKLPEPIRLADRLADEAS